MGDELLDEATRLADDWRATREGDVLRALVERVEEAEAARDDRREFATSMEDYDLGWGDGHAAGERGYFAKHVCPARIERGREHLATKRELREARGKLDAVKALAHRVQSDCAHHEAHESDPADVRTADGWVNVDDYVQDMLAIIDAEGSTRPQDATEG